MKAILRKDLQHLDIIVRGKVQGVFFRASTQEVAERLGIYGEVRNHADGSVRIAVEGEEEQLQHLLSWLQQGPEKAVVKHVEVGHGEISHYSEFRVSA